MQFGLGDLLERLRLLRSSRIQQFRVKYHVSLCNRHPEPQRVGIAIPVPQNRSNQRILTTPQLNPVDVRFQTDLYGNTIAFWERNLHAYETLESELIFDIETNPATVITDQRSGIPWSESNRFIIPKDPRIVSLSRKAISGFSTRIQQIEELHKLTMDRLTYGNPIPGLYSASEAIERRMVDCGGYASLFCSLAISVGIPARIVSGFWESTKNADMHAWAEAQRENGEWIPVDSSVEFLRKQKRTKRRGGLGYVGSDRIVYSLGCGMTVSMCGLTIPVDILQHPVISAERGLSSVHYSFSHRVSVL